MNKLLLSTSLITTFTIATVSNLAVSKSSSGAEALPPEAITLTGTIRDFKAYRLPNKELNEGGHQDFQRYIGLDGDYETREEFGLIAGDFLDEAGKPVYKPGNGSTITTTNQENFSQWYRDVPGVNRSMSHSITLRDDDGDGIYTFARDIDEAESFFPIDHKLFGNEGYEHNYHFTFELATKFTYMPGTVDEPCIFTFKGDDDVFVFIDGKKVIDIGGIHGQREQSVNLDELDLTPGNTYDLKLFFAERNVTHSNFRLDTNLEFEQILYPD